MLTNYFFLNKIFFQGWGSDIFLIWTENSKCTKCALVYNFFKNNLAYLFDWIACPSLPGLIWLYYWMSLTTRGRGPSPTRKRIRSTASCSSFIFSGYWSAKYFAYLYYFPIVKILSNFILIFCIKKCTRLLGHCVARNSVHKRFWGWHYTSEQFWLGFLSGTYWACQKLLSKFHSIFPIYEWTRLPGYTVSFIWKIKSSISLVTGKHQAFVQL